MLPRQPRWVLLDRDGVINRDSADHIRTPQQWQPLPGALQAIARLTGAGCRVAVVTNQSGLARGYFSRDTLARIHQRLFAATAAHGGRVEAVFFCPHGPDDGCACRKPAPGLLLRAMRFLHARAAATVMVGDALRDIEAARRAGVAAVAVGAAATARDEQGPVAADLASAVTQILAGGGP